MQGISMAHFPEMLRVRVPRGLPEALALGARSRNTTTAEYARQALLAILAKDGVRLRNGRVEAELREEARDGIVNLMDYRRKCAICLHDKSSP